MKTNLYFLKIVIFCIIVLLSYLSLFIGEKINKKQERKKYFWKFYGGSVKEEIGHLDI